MRLLLISVFFVVSWSAAFAQNPTPVPSPVPTAIPGGGMMVGNGGMIGLGFGDELQRQSNSCRDPRQAIEGRAYYIKSYFQTENVEKHVNALQAYMKNCKVDPAKYGWGKGTFDHWKKEGYKAELAVLKNRIERQSLMGKVSEKDITEYKTMSERLGISSSDISTYLTKQSGIAAKNRTSCEKKDLRNDILGTPRDQDSIGWCYGFTAADLLSYKLGKKVSAADISTVYNSGWIKDVAVTLGRSEETFEGGRIEYALQAIQKKGICLEKDFRSDDMAGGDLHEFLANVDKAKRSYKKGQNVCDKGQAAVSELFPNINMSEYNDILDKSSQADFLKELQEKSCGKREPIPQVEIVYEDAPGNDLKDKKALMDLIEEQLDKNNISGISYDANPLIISNFERKNTEAFMHGSSVVGRRFNEKTNSCEYLVRNSWGKSCNSYRHPLECEEGNVWVPKEDLMKGLTNVTYIK